MTQLTRSYTTLEIPKRQLTRARKWLGRSKRIKKYREGQVIQNFTVGFKDRPDYSAQFYIINEDKPRLYYCLMGPIPEGAAPVECIIGDMIEDQCDSLSGDFVLFDGDDEFHVRVAVQEA